MPTGELGDSPRGLAVALYSKVTAKPGRVEIIPVTQTEQALWVSDNPDVATVYKGVVTGHSPGEATIKVKFYNKSAKIKINVK